MSSSGDHIIDIIIETNDQTSGALNRIRDNLLNFDRSIQRMNERIHRLADRAHSITLSLIDKVTPAGSGIQRWLHSLANKTHSIILNLTDRTTNKIRAAEAKLFQLTAKAYTITVNLKDNVSKGLKSIGNNVLQSATGFSGDMLAGAGIGYGIYDTVKTYKDFEKQMSAVGAISGASSSQMEMLTQKAREMGTITSFSATEAGKAFEYMATAGWKTDQMMSGIAGIMNLAAASGEDLGRVSDIVTDALTAFNLTANDSGHFADVLAATAANSNTNIGRMGYTFQYVAPIAGAMGQSIEDIATATGLMANAGIKGETAGTSLRYILTALAQDGGKASKALADLGVQTVDNTGKMRPFMEIVKDARTAFKGLSDAEKSSKGYAIAGLPALPGWLAMMNASEADLEKLESAIRNADGAAEQMANRRLDNFAGDLTLLASAWESLQITMMEGSGSNFLRGFTKSLTEVVQRMQRLFSDGIDFSDFGKVLFDIIGRLKNKFLELDGVGSILAGGVLFAGLMKIATTAQRVIGYMNKLRGLEVGQRLGGAGTSTSGRPPTPTGAQSIGTMNVSAGVVNVNGRVTGGAGGRKIGDTSIIDRYNRKKERIRGGGVPPAPSIGSTMRGGAMGGAAFAGIFGLLDVMNVKAMNAERLAQATDENRAQIIRENRQAEWEARAGATGSIIGAAIGAALGSIVGPMGTMVGGTIGGMLGQYLGTEVGKEGVAIENEKAQRDYFGFNESSSTLKLGNNAKRRAADMEESSRREYSALTNLDSARRRSLDLQEQSTRTQLDRFQKIDETLGASSPFKHDASLNATQDYYAQQRNNMQPTGELLQNPLEILSSIVDGLLFSKSEAAELTPEQLATEGQVQMPEIVPPEASPFDEWFNFEGVDERLAELGARITDGLSSAFEGASEILSGFGDTFSEGLNSISEGAGEIFSGLSESISSGLTSAQDAASGALEGIQSSFSSAKESIQSAWSELPGFFSGIFDGLGGVAASAGSAILSGLTSVCGAVISAWESVSSTVSGIIASISAKVSSISLPSVGGFFSGGAQAEAYGGFVTSPRRILAGEDGGEVIIPLSANKRSRALHLFKRTSEILNANGSLGGISGVDILKEEKTDERVNFIIPEYSRTTADDNLLVRQANLPSLVDNFNSVSADEHGNPINADIPISARQANLPSLVDNFNSALTDERRNPINADIPISARQANLPSLVDNFNSALTDERRNPINADIPNEALSPYQTAINLPTGEVSDSQINPPPNENSGLNVAVDLGGVNISLSVNGGDNPQNVAEEVLKVIRNNIERITDEAGNKMAEKLSAIWGNTPLFT